jgi:CBS domain-containing protein
MTFSAQANNPGVLVKQTKERKLQNSKQLGKSTKLIVNALYENIPIAHICQIVGEVNTAITKRAIELSVLKWKRASCPIWLNIESGKKKNNYY